MRVLDATPGVEKTSLFGTAVHAVLRNDAVSLDDLRAALAARGLAVESIEPVLPSLEDVFLDVVDRAGGAARVRKALAVGRKELRQIARDRRTLLILVFVPAFFLLLYGYALNFDIRHVQLGVEDRDGTPESRAIVSAFVNSGYFDLAAAVYEPAAAERLLDLNTARAVLVIPEGLGRDVGAGQQATVQVIISGDNANTATTVMGYAASILRTAGSQLAPGSVRAAAADHRRAAHLVQPGAAQHALPRARPDRLHRDDHRRDLDRALDRPGEGVRARWSRCGWRRSTPSRS